jgi:RNA polymerase sigma factor (sigma-70 family)
MPQRLLASLLWHLRRTTVPARGDSDGELLERFLADGDDTCFPELLRRHGALVMGVCRRVLNDAHEAEDVFQATFLVLYRRAASLDRRASLSGWLHTVAYHLSLRARAKSSRACPTTAEAVDMSVSDTLSDFEHRELRAALDQELERLPAKYREPLILCYLEGKTNAEAANQLGWPLGTVFTRLDRGRDLLRDRLTRRGVTLSATALVAGLSAQATHAAVPAGLAVATLEALGAAAAGKLAASPAAQLAREFLRGFFWRRVGGVTAALVVLLAGTTLATGLARKSATEPGAAKPVLSQVIGQHDGPVSSVAVSPNRVLVASASEDHTARLWTLTGEEVRRLEGHRNMVGPVVFSPEGDRVATGSADREVVLWNAKSGQPVSRSRGHVASVRCLAFSPDGSRLASGGEDASVILHDATTATDQFHLNAQGTVWTLVFSPDSSRLVAGAGSDILIWNLEGDRMAVRLTGHGAAVQALLFSQDGRTLISGSEDGTIRFWDLAAGKEVRRFESGLGQVKCLALSPNGKVLVAAGSEPTIHVWDIARGFPIARLEGHTDSVRSVAFTPDGASLFSGSRDHTLRRWNLENPRTAEKK